MFKSKEHQLQNEGWRMSISSFWATQALENWAFLSWQMIQVSIIYFTKFHIEKTSAKLLQHLRHPTNITKETWSSSNAQSSCTKLIKRSTSRNWPVSHSNFAKLSAIFKCHYSKTKMIKRSALSKAYRNTLQHEVFWYISWEEW